MRIQRPHILLSLILSFVLIVVFCTRQAPKKENLLNTECTVVVGNLGFGTGTFVNTYANPYVLTCKHVINRNNSIFSDKIMLLQVKQDNEYNPEFGEVVLYSKSLDFALIELSRVPIGAQIARYSNFDTRIGDEIFYFGPVGGRPGKLFLFSGFVSQKNIPLTSEDVYDAGYIHTIPGNSGSTIFNKNGEGVGIVCRSTESQCIYLSTDIIKNALNNSGVPALYGILDGSCTKKLSKLHKGPIEIP